MAATTIPRHDGPPGGVLTDFAANDALVAMEEQLRARTNDIFALQEELDATRRNLSASEAKSVQLQARVDSASGPVVNAAQRGPNPNQNAVHATLMAQIQFLHGEIERLEKELVTVRSDTANAARSIHEEHARVMKEKLAEVEQLTASNTKLKAQVGPLQRKVGKLGNGEDLFSRCRMLENQLATAIAERNAAMTEKHNSAVKARKLEATLRGTRESAVVLEQYANEEASAVDEQVRTLHSVINSLNEDRESLRAELVDYRSKDASRRPRRDFQGQCVPTVEAVSAQTETEDEGEKEFAAAGCQVDTLHHYADSYGDSVQIVAHKLEEKCSELDATRAGLDQLSVTHTETLRFLELTKTRLSSELEQRTTLEEENEKLLVQLRALQQQNSQLNATVREQAIAVQKAESRSQDALNSTLRVEEERRQWEHEMQTHQRDMQQLVAAQNMGTQQIAQLSQENDALREEVQKLLQRESQVGFSMKAKDTEMQELIQCYQSAVREVEKHANTINSLNRETDNLRAGVASREERIVALMDQINQLHAREQQLAVDLQSCDYEGGVLHRKMVQADSDNAKLQSQIHELQNQVAAAQRVNFEFERSNAELNKQLVIRDNETMLMRARCDELDHTLTVLSTQHAAEHQRLTELEDANARLVVKGIMASASPQPRPHSADGSQQHEDHHQMSQPPQDASGASVRTPSASAVPHTPHQQSPGAPSTGRLGSSNSKSPQGKPPTASTPPRAPHFPHA